MLRGLKGGDSARVAEATAAAAAAEAAVAAAAAEAASDAASRGGDEDDEFGYEDGKAQLLRACLPCAVPVCPVFALCL